MSALSFSPGVEQTVRVYCNHQHKENLAEINELLKKGWQVVSVTSGSKDGYGQNYPDVFYCLVFERRLQPGK